MKRKVDGLSGIRVHIGGVGRIGTAIALGLHAAGVGEISCNDPQDFDEEQLTVCVFSRRSDIGRPKVQVLARFLEGRPGLTFIPLVAPNQSPEVTPYLERAHLIISSANQLDARLHLERQAIRMRKPCLQASALDGREARGGLVSVWHPDTDCSCVGCLLSANPKFQRGELLLPSVTSSIGAVAVHIAIQLLGPRAKQFTVSHNLFAIDLDDPEIRSMAVRARPECPICGRRKLSCR